MSEAKPDQLTAKQLTEEVGKVPGATPCHRVALVDEEPQTANPAVCATRFSASVRRAPGLKSEVSIPNSPQVSVRDL